MRGCVGDFEQIHQIELSGYLPNLSFGMSLAKTSRSISITKVIKEGSVD